MNQIKKIIIQNKYTTTKTAKCECPECDFHQKMNIDFDKIRKNNKTFINRLKDADIHWTADFIGELKEEDGKCYLVKKERIGKTLTELQLELSTKDNENE